MFTVSLLRNNMLQYSVFAFNIRIVNVTYIDNLDNELSSIRNVRNKKCYSYFGSVISLISI